LLSAPECINGYLNRRRIMMRRFFLPAILLAVGLSAGCQDQLLQPETTGEAVSTAPTLWAVTAPALNADAATADVYREAFDAIDIDFERAINGDDLVCTGTTLIDLANAAIGEIIADPVELAIALELLSLAADQIPLFEAAFLLQQEHKAEYGYDGDFTNAVERTAKDLRRFWDIDGSSIQVVPMKGSMLEDVERVSTVYVEIFGLPEAQADAFAMQVRDLLAQSVLLDGGDHVLFSFNAFAISSSGKIAMGDAVLEGYAELGFGDVAPQAVLAHEWAHHVQSQKGYFDDVVPSFDPAGPDAAEETRYTELMADAMSAYFLTHKRGASLNQKRVEQFLQVFFEIGDCSFTNPGHHGTPLQRMRTARFAFDVADQAQKQGQILTADEFHDLFVAEYLDLIAPDA
jgi:hypothetical protein